MTPSKVKSPRELLAAGEPAPGAPWNLRAVIHEDCLSYLAWNDESREALLIDPKLECAETIEGLARDLRGFLWLAVIDTHTHADHVSCARAMADRFNCPLVMQREAGTTRAQLRVCEETLLPARAGPIVLIPTPGHTPDGLTVTWGPFAFTGDTVFVDDVGRDDLPGGDPKAHHASLKLLRARLPAAVLMLPGHDCRGGRAATWGSQLKSNPSLSQSEKDFVTEAAAFSGPLSPKDLKRALFENLK